MAELEYLLRSKYRPSSSWYIIVAIKIQAKQNFSSIWWIFVRYKLLYTRFHPRQRTIRARTATKRHNLWAIDNAFPHAKILHLSDMGQNANERWCLWISSFHLYFHKGSRYELHGQSWFILAPACTPGSAGYCKNNTNAKIGQRWWKIIILAN